MNSPLSPKVEQLIQERLERGTHQSVTEVIEDAFDALQERDKRESLLADLNEAEEELARGEFTEYDESNMHELFDGVKRRGMARLGIKG